MRKEYYEMLLDVTKTADTRYNPAQACVNVRGRIIEATDSKRAIQIELDSMPAADGLYKIAKVGKEYQLIPSPTEARMPDIDRIINSNNPSQVLDIPQTSICEKTKKTPRHDPAFFGTRIQAIFAGYQNKEPLQLTGISPDFLHICKNLSKLCDVVKFEYIGPTRPIKLSGSSGPDAIRYIVMPMSWPE